MSSKFIYGKLVSNKIITYIKKGIRDVDTEIKPHIAIIQVGNNNASNIYIKKKMEMAKLLNFQFSYIKLDSYSTESKIINLIERLNNNKNIHGIVLQIPICTKTRIDSFNCLNSIKNDKDVEGLNFYHTALLNHGCVDRVYVPCVAASALSIIELAGWHVRGLNVTIIGCGITAGRPITNLLSSYGATVTVCNKNTKFLEKYVNNADLLISSVGKPLFVNGNWLKNGAAIIDCGVHRLNEVITVGDVDITSCIDRAAWLTPVPGGIGPATVSWLFQNLFECFRRAIGLPSLTFSQQFSSSIGSSINPFIPEY
ncbi:hypothetical protein HZS_7210 [Henneguya salminicola]|nr:hypothetical protein HZS_7210 [Henneguya salminicola]